MYYLEYACLVSFADRANPKLPPEEHEKASKLRQSAVVVLSFTYQIGVFISRSSLPILKIKNITLITVGQIIVYLTFFSVALWKWMSIEHQVILMFVCGLFGGASFVNCYYILMQDKSLDKSIKEVAVGLMGMLNELGIISASLFALIISNYVIVIPVEEQVKP